MKSKIPAPPWRRSNVKYISLAGAIFATLTLTAAYSLWHNRPSGPAALIVTPRQYVPLLPGTTTNFTARLLHNDGTESVVSSLGTTWSCAPSIGTIANPALTVTGSVPSFGWVQATCSGLTTRVYIKVSANGTWNPDADCDSDGFSDATEMASNTSPTAITLLDVSAKLSKVLQ